VSVPSIQQVLEENGLGEPKARGSDVGAVQSEFDDRGNQRQLVLKLDDDADAPAPGCRPPPAQEKENGISPRQTQGTEIGSRPMGAGSRRSYSSAQRVYLDQLEQGAYNTYAGGLLFAPLLARYHFLPTLQKVITMPTYEGYRLGELGLTLFYLDVFGFRSMEDFKRAYREEFGVLMGRAQSPSLFTLRRFLHQVRGLGRGGGGLIDEFAVAHLKSELATWGVRYLDGPFMPYYGLCIGSARAGMACARCR